MKNHELFKFKQILDEVSNIKGVKFAYSVLKNKKLVEDEISIIEKTLDMSDSYKEYETKRVNLCELHCEKDETGKPLIVDNMYSIPNKVEFDSIIDGLKDEYKEVLAERQLQIEEYNKLMMEESSIMDKLSKVKVEHLPEELSANQLEFLSCMISDE